MRNGMTERQGIYVVIENNSKLPNVISDAVPLYSKRSTDIGLTLRTFLRLKDPYPSKCSDSYPKLYQNMTLHGTFESARFRNTLTWDILNSSCLP